MYIQNSKNEPVNLRKCSYIIDLPTKRVPFPTDEEVWVEEVWLCPLPNFFLVFALKMVSFGAFWVVFLQLMCLFTAYASIMPVCVTDSETV